MAAPPVGGSRARRASGFAGRVRPRVLRALRRLRSARARRRLARRLLGGVSGAVLGAALLGTAHGGGAQPARPAEGLATGAPAAAARTTSTDAVGMARAAGMLGSAGGRPAAPAGPEPQQRPPAAASRGSVQPLPASTPVSLAVPAIRLRAPLLALGLDKTGAVETPPYDMPGTAAWFRDSPAPGSAGAAVLVGHVDTPTGPAVFWNLAALRAGARIEVTRLDGRVAVFTVERVRSYSKAAFPAKEVYSGSGPADRAELRLITCGGAFDRKRAEYTGNVVVYARLSAVR
ncbi:class F sortase [Phaeacidiphilus oryzae]|uniref:class F sortase n=1 Tax=Phaeacidiphilus oryzae TaxID=348818 RepID=UPI001269F0AA|nr:class F sortase [Phaeacidiphilus oryzae]